MIWRKNSNEKDSVNIPSAATIYEQMLDRLPVAVLQIDLSYRIVYANKKASDLLETPSDSLIGLNVFSAFSLPDHHSPESSIRKAIEYGKSSEHQALLNHLQTVHVSTNPLFDDGEHLTGAMITIEPRISWDNFNTTLRDLTGVLRKGKLKVRTNDTAAQKSDQLPLSLINEALDAALNPLHHLVERLESLAEGDLTATIQQPAYGDHARANQAFMALRNKLNNAFARIVQLAVETNVIAKQVDQFTQSGQNLFDNQMRCINRMEERCEPILNDISSSVQAEMQTLLVGKQFEQSIGRLIKEAEKQKELIASVSELVANPETLLDASKHLFDVMQQTVIRQAASDEDISGVDESTQAIIRETLGFIHDQTSVVKESKRIHSQIAISLISSSESLETLKNQASQFTDMLEASTSRTRANFASINFITSNVKRLHSLIEAQSVRIQMIASLSEKISNLSRNVLSTTAGFRHAGNTNHLLKSLRRDKKLADPTEENTDINELSLKLEQISDDLDELLLPLSDSTPEEEMNDFLTSLRKLIDKDPGQEPPSSSSRE